MTVKNKIKHYKGWTVKSVETVSLYNSRHNRSIDIFFNLDGQPYKRGYVVFLTHTQGGEARTLIKNKFDLQEFLHFI